MAISFVNNGTFASGVASVSPGVPAGTVAGDYLLLFVESANQAIATPAGWTLLSTASGGTAGAAGGVRLSAFQKIAGASESAPSITDTGDHTTALIQAWRGVDPVAPVNIITGQFQAATNSVAWLAVTTTVPGCRIINALANDRDANSSSNISGVANASLSGITLHFDQTVTSGSGGGIAVASGLLTAAGSSGATTATNAATVANANLTIALAPLQASMPATVATFTVSGKAANVVKSTLFTPLAKGTFTLDALAGANFHVKMPAATGGFAVSSVGATLVPPAGSLAVAAIATTHPLALGLSLGEVHVNMPAAVRSYALIGVATTLRGPARLTADVRTYAATTQTALFKVDRVLTAQTAIQVLGATGRDVIFRVTMPAATGAFSIQATAIGFGGSQRFITASFTNFLVTGRIANLKSGNVLNAAAGSFAASGQAIAYKWDHILAATQATYTLSGEAIAFIGGGNSASVATTVPLALGWGLGTSAGRSLGAETATFALTGQAAGLIASPSSAFIGTTVPLALGLTLVGQASYEITADSASFQFAFAASASDFEASVSPATFLVTGRAASFSTNAPARLITSATSFSLTGYTNSFLRALRLPAVKATFATAGQSIGFVVPNTIFPEPASIVLTGNAASFLRSLISPVAMRTAVLAGQSVGLLRSLRLAADTGAVALTGPATTLGFYNTPLPVTVGTFTSVGLAATFRRTRQLTVPARAFTLGSYPIQMHLPLFANPNTVKVPAGLDAAWVPPGQDMARVAPLG